MTWGLLGAIAMLASSTGGRPFVSCAHVVPPSMDLKIPPELGVVESGPNVAASQNVCCCGQSVAYTVFALLGSIRTSLPLVYSSLYSTLSNVRPPSVER